MLHLRCLTEILESSETQGNIGMKTPKPFQLSVAVHLETSHLICNTNEMTDFYMKCNTGLKWQKIFHEGEIVHHKKCKSDFFTINFTAMAIIYQPTN